MLFTYKYIAHDIERYQAYLDYLFYSVWLPADPAVAFSDDLLAGHSDLQRIYRELHNVDGAAVGKAAYKFSSGLQRIYQLFQPLNQTTRDWLRNGYEANNEIERLCCDKGFAPLTYADIIAAGHEDLSKALKVFYDGVYTSGSFFDLKAFGGMYTTVLLQHFKAFTKVNDEGVCPFCGISPLKGPEDKHREAYDHYMPKKTYPFTAINFRNLVPMCHECNSTEKGTLEPIFKDTKDRTSRVLAYYPFAADHQAPQLSVQVTNPNHATLSRDDIKITVAAPGREEEHASWFRVFGLESRYQSQLTNRNAGRRWLEMIILAPYRDEKKLGLGKFSAKNHTAKSMFEMQLTNARFYPLTELGFLKSGFLTACADVGMFGELKL